MEYKYGDYEKSEHTNQIAYVWELSGSDTEEHGYNRISLSDYGDEKSIIDFSDEWSAFNDEKYYNRNETSENEIEEIATEEETNEFVNDDVLNQLISDYNSISEYDIEQWETGAYPFNAIMSCNGVYIMAYNSNSVFVDLSIEDWDDSRIYPVFRDFIKTLDNSVTDEEVSAGWNELLTGKYIGYKYYDIGSVECMCWVKNMNNGTISYTVKTGCDTYK